MNMIQTSTIYVPENDHRRLTLLAAVLPKNGDRHGAPSLREELDRATVLPREVLPSGVVVVNSRVRFVDVDTGQEEAYVLTWPDRADGGIERISVLAPIGTALLGYREGDEISWPTPGGTRRLRILHVEPVTEESLLDARPDLVAELLAGTR